MWPFLCAPSAYSFRQHSRAFTQFILLHCLPEPFASPLVCVFDSPILASFCVSILLHFMAPGDNPRLKEKKDDKGTRHVKFPLPSAPVPESCSKRGEGLLSVVYLVVGG
ncbi:hypothetical protein Godav_029699 [Gossypium davidsonii]|uniref:Uncharacterized protein n=1 Tax=Gossypium davidsonii TaxID=34287 RepID=A0A7J8TDH9_GOSDV|nr:hypothetical protein [Gossypium davidsonii]